MSQALLSPEPAGSALVTRSSRISIRSLKSAEAEYPGASSVDILSFPALKTPDSKPL